MPSATPVAVTITECHMRRKSNEQATPLFSNCMTFKDTSSRLGRPYIQTCLELHSLDSRPSLIPFLCRYPFKLPTECLLRLLYGLPRPTPDKNKDFGKSSSQHSTAFRRAFPDRSRSMALRRRPRQAGLLLLSKGPTGRRFRFPLCIRYEFVVFSGDWSLGTYAPTI